MDKHIKEYDKVVIKFAGDSGDGMQLTGSQFTETAAIFGNDLATFPDFPAEIRAPQGTIPGVSGFQVQIGNSEIFTAGDFPDVMVIMNAAAYCSNKLWITPGITVIVDESGFERRDLQKAGLETNPLDDGSLKDVNLIVAPISTLTLNELRDSGLDKPSILRCKNMFALGIVYYLFNRSMDHTQSYIRNKFKNKENLIEANLKALKSGYNYADTIEAIQSVYSVAPARLEPGHYKNIKGNEAISYGLMAAAQKSNLPLFLGSYPITPASDILHELSKHKSFGIKSFQAEDEIAAISSAIGASFAGNLAVTTTSGPGLALKSEALGLAIMTELPLVVVNAQRGGPSTGLPTKTEQSDLNQALYGRNGESPLIVIASSTPANCFDFAFEACRLSLEHMTPVILLSDGYLGNGSGPWKIKKMSELPTINVQKTTVSSEEWKPYLRNKYLSRSWSIPGSAGYEHRIGGLEKQDITGNVSYDALNHQKMTEIRANKVQMVQENIPNQEVFGNQTGDLLIVGWGGTYGSLVTAVKSLQEQGKSVSLAHFNYINPLPKNTDEIFSNFNKILVCELNMGQFADYLRAKLPQFNYHKHNKVQGQPFKVIELIRAAEKLLN